MQNSFQTAEILRPDRGRLHVDCNVTSQVRRGRQCVVRGFSAVCAENSRTARHSQTHSWTRLSEDMIMRSADQSADQEVSLRSP
jgi:hypothetical protein